MALGFLGRPALGVAFNCPGPCCAERRRLQAVALEAERVAEPAKAAALAAGEGEWSSPEAKAAAAARAEAFANQPFRVFVAFADRRSLYDADIPIIPGVTRKPHLQFDTWYERTGEAPDTLTVSEAVDRTGQGHVLMRITKGRVSVAP